MRSVPPVQTWFRIPLEHLLVTWIPRPAGIFMMKGQYLVFSNRKGCADQPDDITDMGAGRTIVPKGATSSGTATWFDSTISAGVHPCGDGNRFRWPYRLHTEGTFTVNGFVCRGSNYARSHNQSIIDSKHRYFFPRSRRVDDCLSIRMVQKQRAGNQSDHAHVTSSNTSKGDIWMVRVTPSDRTSNEDYAGAQMPAQTPPGHLCYIHISEWKCIQCDV